MNKPKPGPLVIETWVPEVSRVARMPSWIARKSLSTRPPIPSVAPPSVPPASEPRDATSPAIVSMPEPPPPAAVDLTTSIALAQLADENAALRTQITEMAATMAGLRRDVLAASEDDLVRLALTVAGRVVGRELTVDPSLVVEWARDAVEALAAKDGVVIAVARDVRDAVSADAWNAIGVEHRVQTDPQLAPGILEVRTPEGTVATGKGPRLAAIAEALGVVDP
jgi:hypothetical protein